MSLNTPSIPSDLSGLGDAPPEEVASLLERAAAHPVPEELEALTSLLLDRTLQALRQGSRQEILQEAKALNGVLAGSEGEALEQVQPRFHGAWAALGELLSEAARRSDRAAVDSILLGTKGHGRKLLEELARNGAPMSRAKLRERLSLGESHLSHLLRDLEEADLVVRYRPEGGKEVVVELGPVGREVVEQSVLPKWIETLAGILTRPSMDQQAVVRELLEAGAPSALLANRLAKALAVRPAGKDSSGDAEEADIVQDLQQAEGSEYYAKLGPHPEGRPIRLFSYRDDQKEAA